MGTYEPLERVVVLEGGRKSASEWRAAMNYSLKCLELGGMWVSWNTFTLRPEVFYVKKTRKEIFTQAWRLCSEQKSFADNPKAKKLQDKEETGHQQPQQQCGQQQKQQQEAATPQPVKKRPRQSEPASCGGNSGAGIRALSPLRKGCRRR